jgi:hypothetical protein
VISRRRAPGWIELSVALVALIVSGVSLYIAFRQTDVMHRQLAASIWPAVQYSTSNLRGGEPVISMTLENVGVGPARIHAFSVNHQGRRVTDATAFIAECCAPEDEPVRTITSFVEGRILPAGEAIDFLVLPGDLNSPEVFARFDRIRGEFVIDLCYCSVLEECWMMAGSGREPEPVPACASLDRPGATGRQP